VGAEDVNQAAGDHDSSKREDLRKDVDEADQTTLLNVLDVVRKFCVEEKSTNCFLFKKDADNKHKTAIDELVDTKFLHQVRSRVSLRTGSDEIYEAFMLDLSQYTGSRAKRNLAMIEFWRGKSADKLRRQGLVLSI
jgi:hypothetical protein